GREFLGVAGRVVRGEAGRGGGDHWQERSGEIDAAEGPESDHGADGGAGGIAGEGGEPAGGGDGVPSGAERGRDGVAERGHRGDDAGGGAAEVRRDGGVRGDREVHRHAGEAVFERDVCAAGVCGGGASGAGDTGGR